jgi:antitoxin VapB
MFALAERITQAARIEKLSRLPALQGIYYMYIPWRKAMGTARVFRSGNSQAVRLPKQFRVKSAELEIFRRGDEIVLREKDGNMARAFDLLAGLPDDMEIRRDSDRPQRRKGL